MDIKLDYKPRDWQRKLHKSKAKYKVAVVHRRGGKSVAAVMELLMQGLRSLADSSVENVKMLYVAPTYSMAKNIAWDEIKKQTRSLPEGNGVTKSYLNGDLVFKYGTETNNFTIHLKGSENPDTLRGLGTYYIVIDEYQDCKSDLWNKVLYPTTLDYPDAKVLFIGTPKGTNHFHTIFQDADKKPRWETFHLPITATGIFPADSDLPHPRGWYLDPKFPNRIEKKPITIEDIREDTTDKFGPEAFEQEFLCSWTPSTKGAIYGEQVRHIRESGRFGSFTVDNRVPVNTAWDIGISDEMAIVLFQQIGGERRIVKYIHDHGRGILDYITDLNAWREQNGVAFGYHLAPHDIEVREATNGKSRKEICAKQGFYFTTVKSYKGALADGIEAVRMMLPSCVFNSYETEDLLEALALYHYEYDAKNDVFKKTPKHDRNSHGCDAMRTLAMGERSMIQEDVTVMNGSDNFDPFGF